MGSTFGSRYNEVTEAGKRKEAFPVFLTPVGSVFMVRPATDLERVVTEGCFTLPAFVVVCSLSSVCTLPG